MLTWLRRRRVATPATPPLTRTVPTAPAVRLAHWHRLTREEKRAFRPYVLGWEEGYEAALRAFRERGFVPDVTNYTQRGG